MMRTAVLACLLIYLGAASVRADQAWANYTNARYGTTIDYPADLLEPLPPPENGDGLRFEGEGGRIRLSAFASQNIFAMSLEALAAFDVETCNCDEVTYQRIGDDWYVLSGFRTNDIFYRKSILADGGDVQHTFVITYPSEEKARFDPIVTRMAKSFRAAP